MVKSDLVAKIAEKSGLTKKDANMFMNAFIDSVGETLKSGEDISIMGFGTWKVKHVDECTKMNYLTGKEVVIPGHNRATFKIGKNLREVVR